MNDRARRRLRRPNPRDPEVLERSDDQEADTLGSAATPQIRSQAPRPFIDPKLLTDELDNPQDTFIPSIDEYLQELDEAPPDLWTEEVIVDEPSLEPVPSQPKLVALEPMEMEAEDELKAEESKWTCLGSQGGFAGPNTLSLLSTNLTQDVDELDDVFSAFSNLEPGQTGFVRLGFRVDDDFSSRAAGYARALKYGQDPQPTKQSPASKIMGIFGFFVGHITHSLTRGGKFERPRPSRGQVEELRPVKAIDQSPETKAMIREIEAKSISRAHYEVTLYAGVIGKEEDQQQLATVLRDIHAGFESYTTPFQRLQFEEVDGWMALTGYIEPHSDDRLVLSAEELGEIARIPDDITRPSGVSVRRSLVKPMMPRMLLPVDDPLNPPAGMLPMCIIGKDSEDERIMAMRNEELNQHMFIVGRTGTGKSVLMQWLMYGVAKSGYPIVFMDPHGDSAEEVLDMLVAYCPERVKDIVFVDFGDRDYPVQLNPLDISNPEELEETVHSVMEMLQFQMRLDGTGAPRAVNYAQQAITALAEANLHLTNPDLKCTLLQVTTFFTDTKFRQLVVGLCSNPSIQEAYDPDDGPFEGLSDRQKIDHVMPILRAFQPLGNSPSFANVFASPTNQLDFATLINERKIILLKLSKHGSQKGLASFVGSLVIPYMLQSKDAWGRIRNPKTGQREGQGVRLFVDEAHSVIGDAGSSVMTVLAESRKWDFGLVAATQYPRQLDREVEEAFYGNTASKISLALDPSAVRGINQSLDGGSGKLGREDIIRLPPYWGYMNLLLGDSNSNKQPSGPFSGLFLAPIADMMREKGIAGPQGTDEHDERVLKVKKQSQSIICDHVKEVMDRRQGYTARLKQALGQTMQERIQRDPTLAREDDAWEEGWEETPWSEESEDKFPWEQ